MRLLPGGQQEVIPGQQQQQGQWNHVDLEIPNHHHKDLNDQDNVTIKRIQYNFQVNVQMIEITS